MNIPVSQRFDYMWIDIHAEDFESVCGKGGGCWQSDISQPKNADFFKVHRCSLPPPPAARSTSPQFDIRSLYANQDFGVEFGGGWEGIQCRTYYKALRCCCLHNLGMTNFVNNSGIQLTDVTHRPEGLISSTRSFTITFGTFCVR